MKNRTVISFQMAFRSPVCKKNTYRCGNSPALKSAVRSS